MTIRSRMTAAKTKRKPHSMAQDCCCGARFRKEADTLVEVTSAFSDWWQKHSTCKAAA